jgi:membrane-bound lytic murein transglycosylase D
VNALLALILASPAWTFGGASVPVSYDPPPVIGTRHLEHTPLEVDAPKLDGLTVPVTLNGPVRDFMAFFQGRGRRIYANWYARMGAYEAMMAPILEKHGVPRELLFLCMIESGFDPDAVSRAAAVGQWQFIRTTGDHYGLRYDAWVDARRDPVEATDAAAQHLADLFKRFGSWPLAMAAYNAGVGAVSRGIRRANTNDFWRLAELGVLPTEATKYVPKIMAAMIIGQQPARYGFGGVQRHQSLTYAEVPVPGKVDLHQFARRAQVPVDLLLKLNAQLKRGYTPPDGQDYPLRVPPEAAPLLRASLAKSAPKKQTFVEHTVRFGERLRDVAQTYGASRRQLRLANRLPQGQPRAGTVLVVAKGEHPARAALADELLVVLEHDVHFAEPGKRQVWFPVRRKLAIDEVAAFFGVSPGHLAMWNGLDLTAPLQRGQVLRIFVRQGFDDRSALLADPQQLTVVQSLTEAASNAVKHAARKRAPTVRRTDYVVKSGDTVGKIAKRHGITINAIRAENGMDRSVRIAPGDTLWLPVRKTPKPKGKAKRRAPKREARGRTQYKVRSGDSLRKIARKFGVDIKTLQRRNGMRRKSRIYPGQTLVIP